MQSDRFDPPTRKPTPPPSPRPKPPTLGTLEAEMYEMSNPWAGSLSLNLKTASCVISPEILFFSFLFFFFPFRLRFRNARP